MDGYFQNLIDALDIPRDERAVRNALRNLTEATGFDRYAYLHVHGTETTALSDYSAAWQQHYLDSRYTTIDPVVTSAKRSQEMFVWSGDDVGRSTPQEVRRFYGEASEFGIRSGVSFPVRTSFGRTAILTLASDRPHVDGSLLRDPTRAALAVAFVHLNLSLTTASELVAPAFSLTTQEATCLSWSSHGKPMPQIARIIGIKPRTVQFHLDNARDKLGAANLQHAVRIAIKHRLI